MTAAQNLDPREFAELEEIAECNTCSSPAIAPRYAGDLWACAECGVLFRNPRPTLREIVRSYDSGATYAAWQHEDAARARLWAKRIGIVLRYKRAGALLDVGTGDGRFLDFAKPHFEVASTEVSESGARIARERGHAPLVGPLNGIALPERHFDVVTMWHVLEHVLYPGRDLEKVRRSIKPGGILALAVPNEAAALLRHKLPGRAARHPLGWLAFGQEIHLTHFVPATLRGLLQSAGFRILEMGVDDVHVERTPVRVASYHANRILNSLCGFQFDQAMYVVCTPRDDTPLSSGRDVPHRSESMTRRTVRYYSMGDVSGYSVAAVGYVRGLVNAGVDVEWIRLRWPDDLRFDRLQVLAGDCPLLTAGGNTSEGNFADVRTLAARTSRPVSAGTVIAHLPPEMWPTVFAHAGGARRVGMTAWETDRPPAYWLPLLDQAERIVVPCRMNRDDFMRAGVRPSVHAVPHVRRHRHAGFEPVELEALRKRLGIAPGATVFYCIGAWDPRKAMPDLIDAFARAFRAGEPASLVLKTPANGYGEAPFHAPSPVRDLFAATCEGLAARLGRELPSIVLVDGETDDLGIDMLHALGDCYVSLSRGEGWGLGAFDAAGLGKPVVTAAWSAAPDYLAPEGGHWPGAIPHRLASAPSFPPSQPKFFPSQRWAQPDPEAAAALMRRFRDDGGEMRAAARAIREDILNRFSEPVVTRQLLEAIDG